MNKWTPESMYFVYLIACEFKNDILLKIGKTRCIQNRLKAIQTNCPHKISNIFIITSEYEEDIIGLEKLVHKLLFNHSCKLNGEWYLGTKEFFRFFEDLEKINNRHFCFDFIYENEDRFALEEIEILLHKHNYQFYVIQLPIFSRLINVSDMVIGAQTMYLRAVSSTNVTHPSKLR